MCDFQQLDCFYTFVMCGLFVVLRFFFFLCNIIRCGEFGVRVYDPPGKCEINTVLMFIMAEKWSYYHQEGSNYFYFFFLFCGVILILFSNFVILIFFWFFKLLTAFVCIIYTKSGGELSSCYCWDLFSVLLDLILFIFLGNVYSVKRRSLLLWKCAKVVFLRQTMWTFFCLTCH